MKCFHFQSGFLAKSLEKEPIEITAARS